jgi:hypothetical protein
MERLRPRIIAAIALVLSGLTIILTVPTVYEGPLLLYINEQHAIRLLDAIGLVLAVPSWLYLNLIAVRQSVRQRRENVETAD